MMKSALCFIAAVGFTGGAIAQEGRPINQWDTTTWAPEGQAACGVWLTKFGIGMSIKNKTNATLEILFRGVALNRLSEMTDPDTNARAWTSPAVLSGDEGAAMLMGCVDLANIAKQNGMIPQSILDEALAKANAMMRD